MGQDYPFSTAQHENQWHQFFTEDDPDELENWEDAIDDICESAYVIQPEYGRIVVASDDDADALRSHTHLIINGEKRRIKMMEKKRTLSDIAYEIRKEHRQFDIQVNYRINQYDDGIRYLTGRIFVRPFSGDNVDMKMVRDQIMEKYAEKGVSVRYLDEKYLLDLYVAGH